MVDDPLIGKVLNERFRIVSRIGTGGMGLVYKAVQLPLERVVALKVLNPWYDAEKDPEFEKRFFLEASVTSKLKHPNTVTVHDYGRTDDGLLYLAMEYLEGETLHLLLARETKLPWQRAMNIGSQIARSVREAHQAHLVHRDLKPANIMLLSDATGGDMVKVLDFGLVKALPTPENPADSDEEITLSGVLMGSPMYIAPEQARREFDGRTDIYTLGILLFQMLTGRPPFQGTDSLELIVQHMKEAPPSVGSLVTGVPPAVEALVMKCLEKEPQARFQTMGEVIDAIRDVMAGQNNGGLFLDPRRAPVAPQEPVEAPAPPAPVLKNQLILVGAAFAVVLLIALALWLRSHAS